MYEILIVLLSLLLGWGLAKITREELAAGKRYFQAICSGVLVILVVLILLQGLNWMLLVGILIGLGGGFILQQPYFYFGFLGMMTAWGFPRDGFVLLVGMFSLSYCSLHYRKLSWKLVGLAAGFFVVSYGILLFDFPYHSLLYGIIIGGFVHVARGLYSGA